jgi:hypothetical protein
VQRSRVRSLRLMDWQRPPGISWVSGIEGEQVMWMFENERSTKRSEDAKFNILIFH